MKKILKVFIRFGPAVAACLTVVTSLEANTATSWLWHQSEAPKGLDKFKRFK